MSHTKQTYKLNKTPLINRKISKFTLQPKKHKTEESLQANIPSFLKLCFSNLSNFEGNDTDQIYLKNKIEFQNSFLLLPFNRFSNRRKTQVHLRLLEKLSVKYKLRQIKEQNDIAKSIRDKYSRKIENLLKKEVNSQNSDEWDPFYEIVNELKLTKDAWLSYLKYIKSIKEPFINLINYYMTDLYLNKTIFSNHKIDHANHDSKNDDILKESCLAFNLSLSSLNENFSKLYSEVIEPNFSCKNELNKIFTKARMSFTRLYVLRLCLDAIGEGSPIKLSNMTERDLNIKSFNDDFLLQANDMTEYCNAFLSLLKELEKSPRFMENRHDLFVDLEYEFELQDITIRILIEFIEGVVDCSEGLIDTYLNDIMIVEKEIDAHSALHKKFIKFFTQHLTGVSDNLEKTKIVKQTLNEMDKYSLECLSFNESFMIKWLSLNEKQLILNKNLIDTINQVENQLQNILLTFKFKKNDLKKLNNYFLCDKISWKMTSQEKQQFIN